jgi:hypothetical protein
MKLKIIIESKTDASSLLIIIIIIIKNNVVYLKLFALIKYNLII